MSVKCEGCVKEVKPQVVKQVVVIVEEGANKDWCKNIDKKDCPTFLPHQIYSIFYWVFGKTSPRQKILSGNGAGYIQTLLFQFSTPAKCLFSEKNIAML